MSDMTLLPTGGFGGEAGAAGIGGAVGGLIGSWFGNGFGRGGWGGAYDGAGAAIGVGATALMDGMSGMLSFMTTGKLNSNQIELAKRIAVKVIAVLGTME